VALKVYETVLYGLLETPAGASFESQKWISETKTMWSEMKAARVDFRALRYGDFLPSLRARWLIDRPLLGKI
jgi:hypothetical protein